MNRKKKRTTKKKNALPLSARAGVRQWRQSRQPITEKDIRWRLDQWHKRITTGIIEATAQAATEFRLSALSEARRVANELVSLPGVELEVCQYAVIAQASLQYLLNRLQGAIEDAAVKAERPAPKAARRSREHDA